MMRPHLCVPESLPRTRGDRPSGARGWDWAGWSSPHTRGSTRKEHHQHHRRRGHRVFPAHAGIDPRPGCRRRGRSGLPRTRGDRPDALVLDVAQDPSSPHTRGSTRHRELLAHGEAVFPAHAGIDPSPCRWYRRVACLPRTRGDRPAYGRALFPAGKSSPHTRGSTHRARHHHTLGAVFPAHAGIDHNSEYAVAQALGLPRTRGDRPSSGPFSPTR